MSTAQSLLNAVLEDDEGNVLKALKEGAPPDTFIPRERLPFDGQGNTVLHYAAKHSSVSIVRALLERGADATAMNQYRNQPIHLAADGGRVESLRALLESSSRVDVNSRNCQGSTALHLCTRSGNSRIAQELLLHGANVDVQDFSGCTPLHHALSHGSVNVIKALVRSNADVHIQDRSSQSCRELARELGYDLSEIFDPKSDIKIPQEVELIKAVFYKNVPGTESCLRNSSNPNMRVPLCILSPCNSTLLHLAAFKGYEGITDVLLKYGANRSLKNSKNVTALRVAENKQKLDVARCLRRAARPDYKNTSSPRGIVFVLNNKFSGRELRRGAQLDDSTISTLFESMDYDVRLRENLSKEETFAELEKLSSDPVLEEVDSMFFFLLSHGKNDKIQSMDKQEMSVSEMMEMFKGNRCSALDGKPQIWFCNFCRGEKQEMETDAMSGESFPPTPPEPTAPVPATSRGFRDTLVIYPTQRDFKALRGVAMGTVGVAMFCEAISENMGEEFKVIIDFYQEKMISHTTPHVENFAFNRRFFLNIAR
ncbi:uncharacterized protein LOC143017754 [Oratosquilla oratoria]|uniref:uncharacterized protein LOC143017754 n=1 Tax=Oratosquilla oratoria TaxID=337810 RepID=UPI003F75D8F9